MAYKLEGNWKNGLAYDLHTISSVYIGQDEYGHDRYDTTRSEMGELVYQLKYKHDDSVVNKIVDLLHNIKGLEKIHAIIPIPPSNKNRTSQPVFSVALKFCERLNIFVYLDFLEKTGKPEELKNITEPKERENALKKSMRIAKKYDVKDKNVLLFDDLYRSGSTLKVATELLYKEAKVKNVFVLTMTKTRRNR